MTESEKHKDKKPTVAQTVGFGIGNMANQIFDSGIQYIVLQVFNIALGVNPFLVGLAQSLARSVGLLSDPLAGYFSDSLRNRIGFRFFLILGSLVGGISFALIWFFPRNLSSFGYFSWLLIGFTITVISWSIFSVPRAAIGIEMTNDPHERSKLMTIAGFLAIFCNFCLCWAYAVTQLRIFGGTINGSRWVGGAMGVGIVVFGLLSAFALGGSQRGKGIILNRPSGKVRPSIKDFGNAALRVLRCRPFMIIAGSSALIQVGLISADMGLLPCIVIYYVCGGNQARGAIVLGAVATAWLVAALAVSAPVMWMSQKIGKKYTLLFFLGLTFVGSSMRWLFYDTARPFLVVIPFALYGCGTGALFLLGPSMTADTCDLEESISGICNSGMFSALFYWLNKFGTSLGTVATGVLLNVTGFVAENGSMLSSKAVTNMKIVDTAVPTLSLAIGIAMIWTYPLTAKRMESVRIILRERDQSLMMIAE